MKIALVGNLNNNFSSIARYLLDEGLDAYLYRFGNEPDHFAPEQDMFLNVLADRTYTLPFYKTIDIFDNNLRSLQLEFDKYDLVIGCGYLPAWFSRIGKRLDVFIPYGSDIYSAPFFKFTLNPKYFIGNLIFSKHQRSGIRNTHFTMLEIQSDLTEHQISKIGLKGKRFKTSVPMIHLPTYQNISEENLKKLEFYPQYKALREKYDLIIFHHSRHSWFNPEDLNEQKGNDRLFNGFALFLRNNPECKAAIITLEYGKDVDKSKEMISELGITKEVYWFPRQSRKEIMVGISFSDIVVAELHGDYNLYGTVIEGLVCGKTIMQYRDENKHKNVYDNGLHPALIANSSETVCEQLSLFNNNKAFYASEGLKGLNWYKENIVLPFKEAINCILKQKNERSN